MKIRITFSLSDEDRRAIAERFGKNGLADRATCRRFLEGNALADLDWIVADLEEEKTR